MKGTKGAYIAYPRHSDKIILEGFSDSDWAGDEQDRKSTSGYVFFIGGAPVSWATQKQKSVALSTAEAEYMALSAAVQESIFLCRLLGEIGAEQNGPTVIHVDNQACISMSKDPVAYKRSKHIDIRYHFTRTAVDEGKI